MILWYYWFYFLTLTLRETFWMTNIFHLLLKFNTYSMKFEAKLQTVPNSFIRSVTLSHHIKHPLKKSLSSAQQSNLPAAWWFLVPSAEPNLNCEEVLCCSVMSAVPLCLYAGRLCLRVLARPAVHFRYDCHWFLKMHMLICKIMVCLSLVSMSFFVHLQQVCNSASVQTKPVGILSTQTRVKQIIICHVLSNNLAHISV